MQFSKLCVNSVGSNSDRKVCYCAKLTLKSIRYKHGFNNGTRDDCEK